MIIQLKIFGCRNVQHNKINQTFESWSACIPAGTGRLMVKSSENEELKQEVFPIINNSKASDIN